MYTSDGKEAFFNLLKRKRPKAVEMSEMGHVGGHLIGN